MGKDRLRSVGVSKLRSSPYRAILTTARVGPYVILCAIYIPPYGTRDTTLTPWISKNHLFTGSQACHLTTCHLSHRATDHRLTRHQSHHPPSHWIIRPLTHWLTIGSWAHHLHLGTWYTGTLTLAPWHWHSIGSPSHWLMYLGSHHLPVVKPVKG